MRYQVHLINSPNPLTVDATEFHPMGGGVIFYKERMRNTLGNDTWGNPRRMPARVTVAYMTNIESILEIPEEDEPVAEGVDPSGDFQPPVRFFGATPNMDIGGDRWMLDPIQPALVVNAATRANGGGVPHMPEPPIGIDDDGVEWDEQRDE